MFILNHIELLLILTNYLGSVVLICRVAAFKMNIKFTVEFELQSVLILSMTDDFFVVYSDTIGMVCTPVARVFSEVQCR